MLISENILLHIARVTDCCYILSVLTQLCTQVLEECLVEGLHSSLQLAIEVTKLAFNLTLQYGPLASNTAPVPPAVSPQLTQCVFSTHNEFLTACSLLQLVKKILAAENHAHALKVHSLSFIINMPVSAIQSLTDSATVTSLVQILAVQLQTPNSDDGSAT